MQVDLSSKIMAFLSYLLFFFGIVPLILYLFKKNDIFVRTHTKNAAYLFYCWLGINLFTAPLKIFYRGSIIGFAATNISFLIGLSLFILWVWLMINSARGKIDSSFFGRLVKKRWALLSLVGVLILSIIWFMIILGINGVNLGPLHLSVIFK